MMSMKRWLRWTLISTTLVMVLGYTWLMEENLASGVLLSSEIRLHRCADALLEPGATPSPAGLQVGARNAIPSANGMPMLFRTRESLPAQIGEHLPAELSDGQFTIIENDEVGLLNIGYFLHLYRVSPDGEGLHLVQRLVLAEQESGRVREFDERMYRRTLFPAAIFVFASACIVFFFGRRVTKATMELLSWSDGLTIDALPEKPPKLPFEEMQRIAAGTLASLQREGDAIDHQHRFLRFASHELRTPLAIASANAELLGRHGVQDKGLAAFARLEESLSTMKNLTNTLLWLGRGESPLPEPESVDLVALVSRVFQENADLAKINRVEIEVVQDSGATVFQPRVLLEILCSNLMGNAIRYTRDGSVKIRLCEETIEIENRGAQIGGEVSARGHGLGLQLVAWVVERAKWRWTEEGNDDYRRHRVVFSYLPRSTKS